MLTPLLFALEIKFVLKIESNSIFFCNCVMPQDHARESIFPISQFMKMFNSVQRSNKPDILIGQ